MNVRTVFGVFAWMFSGSLDARKVSSLVGVSSDKHSTNYLLSKLQPNKVSFENNEETISVKSKKGRKRSIDQHILYATTPVVLSKPDAPKIYIYPETVYDTFYVSGVDEDDTHLIIYDMDGNCIAGEYGNEIEVGFLPKGTYILGINEYFIKFLKL